MSEKLNHFIEKMDNRHWLREYLIIVLQLIIIASFIHHFNVEAQFNLPLLFTLVGVAFIIHAFTPHTYRQYVFVGATVIGLFILLSPLEVFFVIAVILLLVSICNLPIHLVWRKVLVLIAGMVMTYLRFGHFSNWLSSSAMTILGSMLMFRILVFLYELKYQKQTIPFLTQLSYFLMLPNIILPLFPVVDYKLFHRQYFDQDSLDSYRRGVLLISRGVLCLIAYRLIYNHLHLTISEVHSLPTFLAYACSSYLLTFRLAGMFHLSVGMLHLFGYRLPDPFSHHFFASGFGDLWRRINIYWKDFIVKLYFNPLYFRLKKFGTKRALVIATLLSFGLTLFFHQYQTFWLTGIITVSWTDLLFWGFFGLSIAIGNVIVFKPIKSISRKWQSFTKAAKIMITFLIMSLLWTVWISKSLTAWLYLIASIDVSFADVLSLFFTGILVVFLFGVVIHKKLTFSKAFSDRTVSFVAIVPILLLAISFNGFTLKHFWNHKMDGKDIHALFNMTLKDEEVHKQIAGYYDQILVSSDLMNPTVDNGVIWSKMFQVNLYQKGIVYKSNDAYKRKIDTSRSETFQGIALSTNQYGMYDDEYTQEPNGRNFRVAMLGASIEMGWAIPYDQGFEKIIEKRLNEELELKNDVQKIELLNFSVPSRTVINHFHALKNDIVDFQPDIVVIFDHDETDWVNMVNDFANYDYSKDFDQYVDSVYLTKDLNTSDINNRLKHLEPLRQSLMKQFYEEIIRICSGIQAQSILVEMPELNEHQYKVKYAHHEIAKEAGFQLIDLSNMFSKQEIDKYAMDAIGHPTLEGNELIADELYTEVYPLIKRQLVENSN